MKKNFFLHSLPFRLLVGVAFGICIGLLLNIIDESAITTAVLNVVVTSKYILGQLISFSVPLIIIGFIAPSITRLGNNASRMLGVAVSIAYASSLGAALFSALSGYRQETDHGGLCGGEGKVVIVLQLHCQSSQSFAGCSF